MPTVPDEAFFRPETSPGEEEASAQNSSVRSPSVSPLVPTLINTPTNFRGGMAVASDPAVELAPLRYKYLEIVHNRELANHHGNYSSPVLLDCHAQELVAWWVNNIDSQVKSL
ncbi:hypothetical protein E2C01_040087 [Portunus trituberculatus]|uniref:Uncharacterized protein n=1 Tax=Portunus trituberculatus TaxID=210409 RepID=A0A5B7FMD0_PORTR|nr:hypothetical protein [Portunus trituberculatus]